jgi:hypothetical protein
VKEDIDFIFAQCKVSLTSFYGRKRARKTSGSSAQRFLSAHNLLLLALYSVRKNPTIVELSQTFKTPTTTVCELRERLFPLLQRCLSPWIKVPASIPGFEGGELNGASLSIDTTPTPIPRPTSKADRKLYFNYKKKPTAYAMKTQIVVGMDLKIWDVSETYPCSVHDLTVLRQSSVPGFLSEEIQALGDAAYVGEPHVQTPFKKPRGRELKRAQKLFNKKISHVRISVENTFKRLKDFKIISTVYRGDYHKLEDFNCIFKLVCALVNIDFEKHPLRRNLRNLKDLPNTI